MATEQVNIFTNEVIEYGNIQTSGTTIDFTDWPVPGSVNPSAFTTTPFYLTATVPAQGYYEIEFMQANTFWNCNFAFGVSKCGQEIRLGIAHMIDRANFAANDPNIVAGAGVPIDLPIATTTAGNAAVANRCSWDPLSVEFGNRAGTTCAQELDSNYHGGVAYRNQTAPVTGNPSGCSTTVVSACQPQGSPDLNLAAQHFVNAGIASGFNAATSVLTGLATGISICGQAGSGCTVPNFFVRNDHLPRLDLGNAYASQICYLFTGSFTIPCTPFLTVTDGSITQFLGFQTSPNSVNKSWWFYTAGFSGPTFYDGSYFFGYDSTFASASCPTPGTASCTTIVLGGGTCNNAAVPTASAGDYQYICSPTYDSLALQLETSPCLSNTVAPNPDPLTGSNTNSSLANGQCQGTTILTSHSALLRAEDYFGRFVLTLPVFETKDQFGYLQCDPSQVVGGSCPAGSSWSRAVNDADLGLANFWTWLNTYSGRSGSGLANTIRQGFKEKIRNENPFIASTIWDVFILGNVYDSLYVRDPLSAGTVFNWMTTSTTPESAVSYNGGLSGPPAGTCTQASGCTYRFTLPTYLTWQDGRQVTAYDVAFSYLALVGNGAFLGTGGATMSGITILNPLQFDISVQSNGPFELQTLTGIPIIPGYWASGVGGSTWASAVAACSGKTPCADVQYTLSGTTVNCAGACTNFPAANMQVNTAWLSPAYSPIASHTFVGSGAWTCGTVSGTTGSGTCDSPAGAGSAALSFTLSANNNYFRSTTKAATWIWSGESDQSGQALAAASAVGSCDNVAVNLSGTCGHYQQGIGNPGSGTPVSVSTVTSVDAFYLVNWVAPFNWATSTPVGIGAPFPPVLYIPTTGQAFDGSFTLTPAPTTGSPCNTPNTFYNC